MDALAPLIASAINAGTPLMLAALGLLINEKSGVINMGSEGMMLVAAVIGFAVTINTDSVALGFAAGALAGMVLAGFFARSEEHTSELHSLMRISYAVFCLTKKKTLQSTKTILTDN